MSPCRNGVSSMSRKPKLTRRDFLSQTPRATLGAAFLAGQADSPAPSRRYGMVIDLDSCIACQSCTIACKVENNLPEGVFWNKVIMWSRGKYPAVTQNFIPQPCMHCDRPPCVSVCPVSARYIRDDGLVLVNYNRCIGCKYCATACPYGVNYASDRKFLHQPFAEGAREISEKQGVTAGRFQASGTGAPYENPSSRIPPRGIITKCTFCSHRIDRGHMVPACVEACPSGARQFGDVADPTGPMASLASSSRAHRLREEQRTEPKVYYLW